MSSKILTFAKFGAEEHMRVFFEKGLVYMNPIQHFRQAEDQQLRGDHYEGVSKIKNLPPGDMEIKAINYKGSYLNIHFSESPAAGRPSASLVLSHDPAGCRWDNPSCS